ncbi:domain of unknown function DUF1730 [Pirellula staleyi DSM 6068]|uniref:4Fe-4S ferredoxin-type domain-containing protein n=1 Tax=Pirellula staleyi (strain ATCC 27377 / DSM 6068 / ICPB 4128) TaxID=530564 RepID=D2R4T2_PIRSD|nr:tRNA epoxyqueuosine(34) reductase QueG [Pirellula staleyi]ADB17148.1 domain of unknown function DUF1730 [Pirellula staleyi DSM 6068]
MSDERDQLTSQLKAEAQRLGFALVGVAPAISPAGFTHLREWIARGYAGEMQYLEKRLEAYAHPRHVLDGVQSVVMLAMHYRTAEPREVVPGTGRISRYAWGDGDYHDIIRERLDNLADWLQEKRASAAVRGVVDTAPLLERELASVAGLGWTGKHTLLINRQAGSYFFLAALLTSEELTTDQPHERDFCGSCTACLEACPTQAFPQAGVLDASRCISYLTIELKGQIPRELRSGLQNWIFGCDVCQDVCPWNRFSPVATEIVFQPREGENPADLLALIALDDAAFRTQFRGTPLWRTKRRGIVRNACVVLGNQRETRAVPQLIQLLRDPEAIIRGAAAWAVGEMASQLESDLARQALAEQLTREEDPEVREELEWALSRFSPSARSEA